MIEAFFARHGADRPRFALDDRRLGAIRRGLVRKIAIAVEETLAAVDREREEDARDAAGQVFAHREHVGPHEQGRQDLEHIIVVGFADLEPLTGEEMAGIALGHGRIATMAVEHAVHVMACRNALEDFADCRGGVHRRLLLAWPG